MEIRILQNTRYRDHLIYVRRLNLETFEYLIVIRGEIYAHSFTFKARLIQKIAYFIKLSKDVYTKRELMKAIAVVRAGATTLIDMKLNKDTVKKPTKISINDLENGKKPKSNKSGERKDNMSN